MTTVQTQADKDAITAAINAATKPLMDFAAALTVETPPAPSVDPTTLSNLQAQLDTVNARVATLQSQVTAEQANVDQLKIANASLQSKIDMVRAAIN